MTSSTVWSLWFGVTRKGVKSPPRAALMRRERVGAEFDDAAGDDGVLGEEEFVIPVDGVEQVSANGLAVAHGKVLVDAQGEGFRREEYRLRSGIGPRRKKVRGRRPEPISTSLRSILRDSTLSGDEKSRGHGRVLVGWMQSFS
jgi:hypothetical protein